MERYGGYCDPVVMGEILRLDEQIAECTRSRRWGEIAPLWEKRVRWQRYMEIERQMKYTFYLLEAWWSRYPAAFAAIEDRRAKMATGLYVRRPGHRHLWKQRKADRPKCGHPTQAGTPCVAPCVFGRDRCRCHGGGAGPKTAEGRKRIAEAQRVRWSRSPMPKQIDMDGSEDGQAGDFIEGVGTYPMQAALPHATGNDLPLRTRKKGQIDAAAGS